MPTVILVYDLHGAAPAAYTKLDAELQALQYTKISQDTTWTGRYKDEVSLDGALTTTKNEFDRSAVKAGAAKYTLTVYGAVDMKSTTAKKP